MIQRGDKVNIALAYCGWFTAYGQGVDYVRNVGYFGWTFTSMSGILYTLEKRGVVVNVPGRYVSKAVEQKAE